MTLPMRHITTRPGLVLLFWLAAMPWSAYGQAPNRGWLGVKVVAVPDAAAAQLDLRKYTGSDTGGMMVANIAIGSPAEQAGFERYDIIVMVNGRPVGDQLTAFANRLRATRAGEKLTVTILRKGRAYNIDVTLIAPTGMPVKYRFDSQPANQPAKSKAVIRAGILRKTKSGWVWEEFKEGDPVVVSKLPSGVKVLARPHDLATTQPTDWFRKRVVKDNIAIEVEIDPEQRIIVRRTPIDTPGARTHARIYPDVKALGDGDRDAFIVYQSMIIRAPEQSTEVAGYGSIAESFERSFQEQPSGAIEVHIRSGNNELVRTFANPKVMQEQSPALYHHYRKTKAFESRR